jgi:O-antigen ligase
MALTHMITKRRGQFGQALNIGAICWLLLWMAINTGPESLDFGLIEGSAAGFWNGIRAVFPLAVLVMWLLHILVRRRRRIRRLTWPEALWLYYGIVCLIASAYAEPWFDYSYWGFAYLSAFAAAEAYMSALPAQRRAGDLNVLSWILCSVLIIAIVWVARGQLLTETSTGLSGYTINLRMPTVAGMPMARASGISRLAAVPAIVALPLVWHAHGARRLIWMAIFLPSAYLVWVMQSRGSLTSLGLALAFVMVMLGGTPRRAGLGLLAMLAALFTLGLLPDGTVHHLWMFATRGTEGQQLTSMSGRVRIFHDSWEAIKAAPIMGYGPQADRQMPNINNSQNGILYALLCAGFVGGSGYIGGLIVSWLIFFRVARSRHQLDQADRIMLVQVAGIMAFFTIRSYLENCAALFSIDLLVQLPAILYVGELDRRLRAAAAARRTVPSSAAPRVLEVPQAVDAGH